MSTYLQPSTLGPADAATLWREFRRAHRSKSSPAYTRLCDAYYYPLLRLHVMVACKRWGYHHYDDFFQDGFGGLSEAIMAFRCSHGVTFNTYAGHRIRGAILDGIRLRDHLTYTMRKRLGDQSPKVIAFSSSGNLPAGAMRWHACSAS